MAVAFVTAAAAQSSFSATQTVAISPSGTNRFILAFAWTDRSGGTTIDSATYNGVSMTAGTAFTFPTSGYNGRAFWLAGDANIATGSHNVVVTASDGNKALGTVASAWTGVDGVSPTANEATVANSGTTVTNTVTSSAGNTVAFVGVYNSSAGAMTATSPASLDDNTSLAGASFHSFLLESAGAASVAIAGTTGSCEWWGTGISINAASSGTSSTPKLLTLGAG